MASTVGMTSTPTTPQKEQLPRKEAQEKIVEKREIVDTSDASLRIEKELTDKLFGTIKLYGAQVDTHWVSDGLIENRAIDANGVKKLVEKFYVGLDRMNPRHHMTVTLAKGNFDKLLQALKMTSEEFIQCHTKQDYPLLTEQIFDQYSGVLGGALPILQAGQHRFAALDTMFPSEEDRWWPVRVYSDDVSLDALDRLRENVNDVHTGLNDGERLLHIYKYEERKQEILGDKGLTEVTKRTKISDLEQAQRLKFSEYDAGSHARAYQVWERVKLREAVVRALRIPGLRACLSFASMGDALSWRMMKVRRPGNGLMFSS
jgi:hypothetical protein